MGRTSNKDKEAQVLKEMKTQENAVSASANENLQQQATDIFNENSSLIETVQLSSRGKIPNTPSEITIRAVKRKDKKKLLMSQTGATLLNLLQACVVSPTNFNVFNLPPFETEYLLYRLKVLSYGPMYTFKDACPYCNHINEVESDLNDIDIIPVPDDFSLVFNIGPLPVSGSVIHCKILNDGELEMIRKQFKNQNGDFSTLDIDILWEYRIIGIDNNMDLAPIEITQHLDELSDYDSEYLGAYYNEYMGNYGIQDDLIYDCDQCNRKVESKMPSIYTFFRPSFKFN